MLTKVYIVKAVDFPVVMYGCKSRNIKKTECWRLDTFEPWCCRRISRVPWTARRSHLSFLKEINPDYSLEGLMLKLKLQYFGHLMWRGEVRGKRPGLRRWGRLKAGEGDDGGWDGWMASLSRWTWVWASFGSWWWTVRLGVLQFMGSQRVRHDWATDLKWKKWIWHSWNRLTDKENKINDYWCDSPYFPFSQ